jgi:hypothetical protein
VALAGACAWLPAFASRFDDEGILGGLITATWVTALLVLIRASQVFAADRPKATLALVLASPLGVPRIWNAHFVGLMCHAARMLVPALALAVVTALDGRIKPGCFAAWLVVTPLLLVVLASFGMWRSAIAATGGKAVLATLVRFIAGLICWGGLILGVIWIMGELGARGERDEVAAFLSCLTPPGWHGFLTCCWEFSHWGSDERVAFAASLVGLSLSLVLCVPMRYRALAALQEEAG